MNRHTYNHEQCAECGAPCKMLGPSITRPVSAWDEPGPVCETCGEENLPGAYRCQICGGRCQRPAAKTA